MKIMQLFKNQTKTGILLVIMLMVMFLAACGSTSNENNNTVPNVEQGATISPTVAPSETPPVTTESAETVYPFTITDATGTEVTFEKAPASIVSLASSETETIFAIGGGDLVVGVDEWSNYPEEVLSIPKVGDMTTNIEAVAALNPELVLAVSSMNVEAITQLRALNIPVYATDPKTYDEVIAKVENVGKIINRNDEAATVADHMRSVKEQVSDAVKDADKKKVYLEISQGWTVGSGEFLNELLTMAGGVNIASAQPGYFEVNAEEVVTQNPVMIIYPDFGEEESSIVASIMSRPGWEAIDAIKNNAIFAVTNDTLVRVGPRIAESLLELAEIIHPELVK